MEGVPSNPPQPLRIGLYMWMYVEGEGQIRMRVFECGCTCSSERSMWWRLCLFFSSVNWTTSFSKYIRALEPFFDSYDSEFTALRQKVSDILQQVFWSNPFSFSELHQSVTIGTCIAEGMRCGTCLHLSVCVSLFVTGESLSFAYVSQTRTRTSSSSGVSTSSSMPAPQLVLCITSEGRSSRVRTDSRPRCCRRTRTSMLRVMAQGRGRQSARPCGGACLHAFI